MSGKKRRPAIQQSFHSNSSSPSSSSSNKLLFSFLMVDLKFRETYSSLRRLHHKREGNKRSPEMKTASTGTTSPPGMRSPPPTSADVQKRLLKYLPPSTHQLWEDISRLATLSIPFFLVSVFVKQSSSRSTHSVKCSSCHCRERNIERARGNVNTTRFAYTSCMN